jgi:type I restriction-modification system DNA methylase subunit
MAKVPELSRHAAEEFSAKWKNTKEEKQYAESFWNDFFRQLCGVEDTQVAGIEFQKPVKNSISGNVNYLDVYWKDVALIEHKSSGESLDKAFLQAKGYWRSLPKGYRPKWIILCNFQFFRLVNVDLNRTYDFPLAELADNIYRFEAIISGNLTRIAENEISVDQVAAKLMANLYLELSSHGFDGHETSIFLNRILFLLFGDDTGMWEKNLFVNLVMQTKEDGSDVGETLDKLFEVLNTDIANRNSNISKSLNGFPYVNGGIFGEKISIIDFNKSMRIALVNAANYDWSTINPTIFGALFQLVKDKETRRELGEHYTSEENINKIVFPLLLDELQDRLDKAWENKKELKKLRQDLAKIKIFDPACGCGNFLVVSYRHLRQLELELIAQLNFLEGKQDVLQLDGSMGLSITLDQIFGIEIDEWASQVAQMALFLTDHQENLKLEKITGITPNRFPLKSAARITQGNALRLDWNQVLSIDVDTFILGNPPFVGMSLMTEEQQQDRNDVFKVFDAESSRTGRLDFVTSWYAKCISTLNGLDVKCAFVSTNSISQGEQARTMGPFFMNTGFEIDFAYPTFSWTSDSSNSAAVHVVIIGFSPKSSNKKKKLFLVNDSDSSVTTKLAKHINFYLVDGPDIELVKRTAPIVAGMPDCTKGSQPTDGGNLFFSEAEKVALQSDPVLQKYLKRFIGATELLYDEHRYCLWLPEASPAELKSSKVILERLAKVAEMRSKSPTASVRQQALTPGLFTQIRQPTTSYFALPNVSSEKREYIPGVFFSSEEIAGNGVLTFPAAPLWLFGFLQSKLFTSWVETFSGRLESRFQIHPAIVYFTFPFIHPDSEQIKAIENLSQNVLDARGGDGTANLATLYDPLVMPLNLRKSHDALDKYMDSLYSKNALDSNSERVQVLIDKYNEILASERLP